MSTIGGVLDDPLDKGGSLAETQPVIGKSSALTPCGSMLNEKARRILDGARSAFHELGYEGTSVDEIARRAGVSKPTLYTYFGDKQALFAASFSNECQGYADEAFRQADFTDAGSVEAGMRQVVHKVITYLLSPNAQAMFRSAVAETSRFPDLGRAYYEAGPGKTKKHIVAMLRQAVEGGVLEIEDFELAAAQLMSLCKSDLFVKQLFSVGGKPTQAEIRRVADGAIKLFFDGYRKRG